MLEVKFGDDTLILLMSDNSDNALVFNTIIILSLYYHYINTVQYYPAFSKFVFTTSAILLFERVI